MTEERSDPADLARERREQIEHILGDARVAEEVSKGGFDPAAVSIQLALANNFRLQAICIHLRIDGPQDAGSPPGAEAAADDDGLLLFPVRRIAAIKALAQFEYDRLERESDVKPVTPIPWEEAEEHVREELVTWAAQALAAMEKAESETEEQS